METDKPDYAYNEKTWKELLAEILKLTLKLIWKLSRRAIKLIIKGIKWAIAYTLEVIKRIIAWWNDNDTQVKVRIVRIKAKILLRTIIKWTIIGAKATGRFLRLACKKAITAIVNLKPTVIAVRDTLIRWCKACIRWSKEQHKIAKRKSAKQKVRYRNFRKTPGFKGLLTDIGNFLKSLINSYMEEEQTEFTPETPNGEESTAKEKKARIISDILLNPVKDLVEEQ